MPADSLPPDDLKGFSPQPVREIWEVVVIGAGAAGLLAAARAAERGRRTLLLEKNRKPGVKILISGGTRCNLTHATDRRGIIQAFGRQGRFLHSALAALGPDELVELFALEGVATTIEPDTGKVFPASNRALDVRDALVARLRRSGATLALGEPVVEFERCGDGFQLRTPLRTLEAARVLVTTGGQSYPGCGTTGDGYGWLAGLGHTIVPPQPALVPITIDTAWVRELRGVTLPDVSLRVLPLDKPSASSGATVDVRPQDEHLQRHRGSLLFTHFGLSGPVVLDVSRMVSVHPQPRSLGLEFDFLPESSEAQLDDYLRQQASTSGKKQISTILPEALPRRLVDVLLTLATTPADRKAAELTKAERLRLVPLMKRLLVPVSGTRGFSKAEVTAGGVSLDEVDSHTMQSKRVPNLYLAGEILDLDGPIGGYNFQAAFSTGWLAAESL
jgi:predicted Rossmann fold flavoprotein